MTRYAVTARLTYVVDLPDEDAVYEHADETDLTDLGHPVLIVERVRVLGDEQ